MNLHEDKTLFNQAITLTSETLNIKRQFVEKDYWICRSLKLMADNDQEHKTIFKGGTSLSKAYNIGARFSEDIDIAVVDASKMSGNQLKMLIHNTAHCMSAGLVEVSKPGITSKGSHYHKAFYAYPLTSDVPSGGAVRTGELLLEINSFANPFPWQMCNIESFITTFLAGNGHWDIVGQFGMESFEVPVLDKRKTLAYGAIPSPKRIEEKLVGLFMLVM